MNNKSPVSDFKPTPEEIDRFSFDVNERRLAKEAMDYTKGSVSKSAVLLGIDRRTFQRRFPKVEWEKNRNKESSPLPSACVHP